MANRGKAAGKKATAAVNPATAGPEKDGIETNVWGPGFLNWDII